MKKELRKEEKNDHKTIDSDEANAENIVVNEELIIRRCSLTIDLDGNFFNHVCKI